MILQESLRSTTLSRLSALPESGRIPVLRATGFPRTALKMFSRGVSAWRFYIGPTAAENRGHGGDDQGQMQVRRL
jgi:hypothetical protein